MGLFNFKKSDNAPKMKSIDEFYNDCIVAFHKEAQKYDVAGKGLIYIPELMPLGEQAILYYLKQDYYKKEFGEIPKMYYFVILSLSLETGLLLGKKWHEDFGELESYAIHVIGDGPLDESLELMKNTFPNSVSDKHGNYFCKAIFDKFDELHEPYWKLKDPRQYTFRGLLAAYQLGISMILKEYGY